MRLVTEIASPTRQMHSPVIPTIIRQLSPPPHRYPSHWNGITTTIGHTAVRWTDVTLHYEGSLNGQSEIPRNITALWYRRFDGGAPIMLPLYRKAVASLRVG